MISEFSLVAGILASALHVITGPDHLAAVAPFVIESKKKAWKIGLSWSIGHIVGMVSIGLLFFLFKNLIPIEKISNYSEQLVGLVLVGIGVWALYKIFWKNTNHKHLHIHTENVPIIHSHKHIHKSEKNHDHRHTKDMKQSYFASFSIGLLHGFAGVAHFILFIPVLGFDNQLDSILYVVGSCIGIILAMTAFAFVIGKVATLSKNEHNPNFFKGARLAVGLCAIIIGTYWVFMN
ncbi:urease accessory protein UreH domain-containing protein [Winogradskyella alexanderae]|uniref:Sulfite exporter TauE/SafE family protein n=1 Tax=Winogradskyella alexanderae TaxID=2877123 RepID=A0ABS7XQK8_9FLAO|nr:sulfite exporter TauE/SafE family protein [Winogradskyella alexanderae]MCA0132286.1 sulfite exporter TauE/SafE family protein [Winogradskyella alexanderae]